MKSRREVLGFFAVAAVFAIASVSACSKKSNPTSPGGGGALELNSGSVPPGGVYKHVFANVGAFPYHCTLHTAMTGNSVTVSASSTNDSAFVQIVNASTPGFSPSSVTIMPGGHVRWINAHTVAHTVTSGS